jgi:undecaprenyl-diphosphatase
VNQGIPLRTLIRMAIDGNASDDDATGSPSNDSELVVINERSGTGIELPDWLAKLPSAPPDEVAAAVAEATAGGRPLRLIVWGGDGTVRTAAKAVAGTDVTLLPAPGGTHNHFAHHVGITNLDELAAARQANVVRRLDVGYVNDEPFLNNANVGWYVELVRRRERYEQRLPRRVAKIASTLVQMFRTHRIALDVDGVPVVAWMVWIGNGQFALEPTRLAEREELRDGVLDVRVLPARGPWPRVRAAFALVRIRHQTGQHESLHRWTATSVELRPRGNAHGIMRVACDGEVVEIMSALRFRCDSAVLRTVIGPDRT